MAIEEKYISEFIKMSECNRKISLPHVDGNRKDVMTLESDIREIFSAIDFFNAHDEFHYLLEDDRRTRFEDVPILNEFKDFVLPRSVRYEPSNLRTKDMLVRPKINGKYKFDIDKYHRVIDDFRRYFKKDAHTDVVALDSLKKHVSLAEVVPFMYVTDESGKYVKSGSSSFVPIQLTSDLTDVFEPGYFDSAYETCLMDYLHKIIF